jgi:hypothetical protein
LDFETLATKPFKIYLLVVTNCQDTHFISEKITHAVVENTNMDLFMALVFIVLSVKLNIFNSVY